MLSFLSNFCTSNSVTALLECIVTVRSRVHIVSILGVHGQTTFIFSFGVAGKASGDLSCY